MAYQFAQFLPLFIIVPLRICLPQSIQGILLRIFLPQIRTHPQLRHEAALLHAAQVLQAQCVELACLAEVLEEIWQIGTHKVRYLEPKFNGVIDGDWMPHDKKRKENNRYQIKFDHNHQLTDKLSGGISFNQVSDDNYYRDFYGREDIASNVNLNRQLWLNYGDNIWGGSFDGALNVQKYQTRSRSEERRVGKECRSRWSPYH